MGRTAASEWESTCTLAKTRHVCAILKEREEAKLSKTSPQAGQVKPAVKSAINLYYFLFQISIKLCQSLKKTGRQLWMHYPFSPIHTSYSQVLDKVVANLLTSTETLEKSWKYSARHPHIWQGWKRPFCQCTNIPFLSLNNPENQKCSGENNIMRGYPEKKRQPTPQAWIWNHTATNNNSKEVLGCTHLFSGAIRFLLPLWPEHFSALILPGRLFPGVTLTEMQGCAPRINLA